MQHIAVLHLDEATFGGADRSLRGAILLRSGTGLAIPGSAFDRKKPSFSFFGLTLSICRYVVPLCPSKERKAVLVVTLSRYGYFHRADS